MNSVMDTAREALTGNNVVGRMSSLLNESESGTRQVLEKAVPVSVAGLASTASTEAGAQALLQTFKHGDYDQIDPGDLGKTVLDTNTAERVMSSSEGTMGRLFGNKLGGIVDGLAGEGGVSRSSASKLLGLAMPLVMGIVGKTVTSRQMDARGLSGFLGEQLRLAASAIPGRLSGMFGLTPALAGGPRTVTEHRERMVEIPRQGGRRSFLPWLVAGLVLLAGLLWVSGRRHHRTAEQIVATAPATPAPPVTTAPATPAPPATTAPAAPAAPTAAEEVTPLSVAVGVEALTRTLDGSAALPARFVVSDLNFRYNSAEIEPSTVQVLDGVAGVLQSHPTAKLRVEGHTDATGNDQANMALSQSRAESVKDYLTGRGISADRLEAVGFGESKPLASNDTVEGRGQNRRTELVVTQR